MFRKTSKKLDNNTRLCVFVAMDGVELKTLRQKFNLKQQELAEKIGTKQQRISEWENGANISPVYQRVLREVFEKLKKKG